MPKLKLTILFLAFIFLPTIAHGATEFISVIDPDNGSGTDYTSLSAWEAANQVDLTAATTLVIAGSLTRGTIADGTPITQTTSGATAVCVHHTETQMLISTLSGTPNATDTWFPTVDGSDATNAWTPTDAGDSAIAIAKCRSTSGTADTTAVTVDGWTTSADNYIKIWTDPSENYRHQGKWDEGKYRLEVPQISGGGSGIRILEEYVWIDGLQIKRVITTEAGQACVAVGGASGEIKISNNVCEIKNNTTYYEYGIYKYTLSSSATYKIWNNVIYGVVDTDNNSGSGMYLAAVSPVAENTYVYNNTVVGSYYGIAKSGGTCISKNNIAYNNTIDYSGTFDSSSTNNLSKDATAPPYNTYYTNTSVIFADETNQDFHLDSADTAARNQGAILYDSGDDANLNFTTDIDNNARLDSAGTWDIGADEGITKVYRSVGPSATAAIATGATYGNVEVKPVYVSGSTTNIADYVATFWSDLPINVGVGDALQYDDDDDGDIDASDSIVFITKRIDASHFSVRTASGTAPASTLAPDSNWSIFRSYTSLFNAEAGDENDSIDDDLEAFESWSGGKDLQTSQEQWNIAAYAGQGGVADTVAVAIDGWTTTADSYIKVYTPTRSDEVGVSQRHSGVWDATKYNLSTGTGVASVDLRENYTVFDGLQITNSGTASTDNDILVAGYISFTNVKNSIIKGGYNGIYHSVSNIIYGGNKFYGNIIYETYYSGIRIYLSGATPLSSYVYNNTVYNCNASNTAWRGGIETLNADVVKNNISMENGNLDFVNANGQSYNISSDATAVGTGSLASQTLSNIAFVSTTSGSEDLHISPTSVAKNIGTDLSNDPYIPFNTDIDSACLRKDKQSRVSNGGDDSCYTRPKGTNWDIGAHELITKIYRSVAPDADGTLEALTTGASNAMTIASSTATFATALADNIGVGDAIQYDADGDGDIDASDSIVFISGRTDSTHFTVKTASGTVPTAVSADTDWSLFRAYTSLANAETGTENLAIDADLRNFDTGNRDLASNSEQWNIACYANGTTADTVEVTISGWTTAAQNYIKIYTPYLSIEVGTSQRHQGVWDEEKYIHLNEINSTAVSNTRIDGLQIYRSGDDGGYYVRGINSGPKAEISNNIIKANLTGSQVHIGISEGYAGVNKIFNNIIYDFNGNAGNEYGIYITGGTNYVYNNTIYNCEYGISQQYSGTILVAKNNIIKGSGNVNAYVGTFTNSDYNATDGTDVGDGGVHSKISQTFSFVDEANDDFHLSPSDTAARNSGADLSQDYNLPIISDIDGHTRPASAIGSGVAMDIGADESATPIYRSIAPSMSTYLDRGVDESGTDLSISGTTMTLENAAPDNVGVGDVIQYDSDGNSSIDAIAFISARASSTSFTVQARDGSQPVAVTNDQDWQIFRAYTTLDNAEGGAENTANIDDDVDDFDISVSRADGKDIYASNEQWNIAAYANGTTADTAAVTISGWTTYPTNYIKIYTPVSASEVGVSQRHEGKWDDGKYNMVVNNNTAFTNQEDFFRVDGLQVEVINPSANSQNCLNFTGLTTGGKIYVSNNILRGHSSETYNQRGIFYYSTMQSVDFYIYNNIVYDFLNNSSSYGFYLGGTISNWYVYNNTVYNCYYGLLALAGADPYYFNNIVQNCTDGFGSTRDASSDFNISNTSQADADSVNATFNGYKTVSFIDEFNDNFHLASYDTAAKGNGVDLSGDSYLPFSTDVDGDTRVRWDIGADEFGATQSIKFRGDVKTRGDVKIR